MRRDGVEWWDSSPIKVKGLIIGLNQVISEHNESLIVFCVKFSTLFIYDNDKIYVGSCKSFLSYQKLILSFLDIMIICKVFRTLRSHIAVTAVHVGWQLSL